MWDPYLRLDLLSVAFIYRRCSDKNYDISDKNYDISEFGMKDCSTTPSLGWKLMMSLGQDEPFYTYNHQCTRHFIREACYGGIVGANIQEFNSSLFGIYKNSQNFQNPTQKAFVT